jgi:hypothetical protein
MGRIASIVQNLCARADEDGAWSISSDELALLLGMDRGEFWRAVYEVRDRISFEDAVDGWSQDSVGDLVTVLERFDGEGVEEEMSRAGLFIPFSPGLELMESFLHRARCFSATHEVAQDELVSMLRHTGSVGKAIGIYLETHTDVESLIDECVESFCSLHGMPRVGRTTARRHLLSLFTRHMLDRKMLFVWLEERLRITAAQYGYFDPEDDPRGARAEREDGTGDRRTSSRASSRHEWACGVLGFSKGSISQESLRARYRQLMMRHHPDVDPSGLERCKDINAAYALLAAEGP